MKSDKGFKAIVIGIACLVAGAGGWLYHVSRVETTDNSHAIVLACKSDNANRLVLRHVLATLRQHPTLPLTKEQAAKRNGLFGGLILSITLEDCG